MEVSTSYTFSDRGRIDRFNIYQTKEKMFAYKLVAVIGCYKKYKTTAGRDIYDINYFFLQGYDFNKEVIEERTGKKTKNYLKELVDFIEKKSMTELAKI